MNGLGKLLVWLVSVALSVWSWTVAYRYAKKMSWWLLPRDFAIIVAVFTLVACMAFVTFLDKIGWYFD
ncbi:MAG: hypothetical protein NTW07_03015 [candidate division Zixibacteria bacterium]|nr:hypothetical protein [candidate division Zixibacteria bacterium]